MSTDFGFDDYCEGGDFSYAAKFFYDNFPTLETEADFPYDYEE